MHATPTVASVELDLFAAQARFRLLDAMDTADMDGMTYRAWAFEHEAAWQLSIDLQEKLRSLLR